MAFVGFDLDETLGTFIGPDPFLHFLEPQKFPPHIITKRLLKKLNIAFDAFAGCLLSKEPALGILRPGIIDISRKLLDLKNKGIIKSIIIYSNNGNSSSLRLAARMIEMALGVPEGTFFCNRVHWNHPLRLRKVNNTVKLNNPRHSSWLKNSNFEIKIDRPGVGVKSINVLKKAVQKGKCNIDYDINNSDILFFDDLIHPNIYNAIGKEHYFNLNRYNKQYDFEVIMKCFTQVMISQNLYNDSEYLSYIKNIIPEANTITLNTIIDKITELENLYKNSLQSQKNIPWINDTIDILDRLNSIYNIKDSNNTNNNSNIVLNNNNSKNNIIGELNNSIARNMLSIAGPENISSRNKEIIGGRINNRKTYKLKRRTSITRRRR